MYRWVHVDDLPKPIVHGWKGILQSIEAANKDIKKIEDALKMKKPPTDMFHKKKEFVMDDLWSRHEGVVDAWCDRLENLAQEVVKESAFDKIYLDAWSRLSPTKRKQEIETMKKWSQDIPQGQSMSAEGRQAQA